ncbi:MAG: hypothetical protein EBR02_03270 [Alphaproteobacteria bacterium]|nr:hypothetical protein [Alphaproteobacteria bacterium]
MSVDSVSSYSLYQSTLRDASKVMADLARNQMQTSTRLKSQDFAGMANDAEQFLSLDSKMTRNQQYINNNKIASARLEQTSTALGSMIENTREIHKNIQFRLQPGNPGDGFGEEITGNWQIMADQLNTSINGRYLFSGTKTDVAPVDGSTFPTTKEAGVPDSSYYHGSEEYTSFRPSDDTEIRYDVRADNPAIQKIIAGMVLSKNAGNSEELKDADALVQAGLKELESLKTSVDAKIVTLNNIDERQTSQQTYWKIIKEELVNADLLSVSTEVAINQGILTAAFQVFAKINSLRLSDFLR